MNTFAIALVWSLLAALILLAVYPRTYSSEAKLLVKMGRESVSLDPTATTSETIQLQKTQEEEVNSSLEVITSRIILETVATRLGLDAILEGRLDETDLTTESQLTNFLGSIKDGVKDFIFDSLSAVRDPISNRERAVNKLEDSVHFWAARKSTVISVYAESKTPRMAQAIAEAVVDAYLDEHLSISHTTGSLAFFETQSAATETKLNQLVDDRAQFLKQNGIVSFDAARGILNQKLASNERTLFDYRDRLEIEERELAANFNPSHPRLEEIRRRLTDVNEVLSKQPAALDLSGLAAQNFNAKTASLSSMKTAAATGSSSTNDRAAKEMKKLFSSKAKQRVQILDQLERLMLLELDLERKNREVGLTESKLRLHQDKLEEARLIDEQQKQRISNVIVFQPPTLVEKPVSPQKAIIGLGVLMLGLGSALCLALWREFHDSSLKTSADVTSSLAVPVVAEIPNLGRRRNLLGHKRSLQTFQNSCRDAILDLVREHSHELKDEPLGILVGVLGINKGCGSSTVAAAIASTCSTELGLKTLLVNTDTTSTVFGERYSLNGAPGLSELLSEEAEFADCVQHIGSSDLGVVACSAPDKLSTATLSTRLLKRQLDENRHSFDIMVVDLPPASESHQPMPIGHYLDSVFVVVESDQTDIAAAKRVVAGFRNAKANINGVVLNKVVKDLPSWLTPA